MRHLLMEATAGRIGVGALLPREMDLAERFDVSRGVARDAIQALRERDVVAVRHGSGARLLPQDEWNLLDVEVLAVLAAAPGSDALRREVLESLTSLEPTAAGLAARRASPEDRARLRASHERMSDGSLVPGYVLDDPRVQAQAAFHDAVMAAAGNRPLRGIAKPLHTGLAVMVSTTLEPGTQLRTLEQHGEVLEAIESGSARKARASLQTLLSSLSELVAA